MVAAQKRGSRPLCKIQLTNPANTSVSYTYGVDTTDRLLSIEHTEDTPLQNAEVTIQNANGNLNALNLLGYKGVISYGYKIAASTEYSACAPLRVIAQRFDSGMGVLSCSFSLAGKANQMSEDHASDDDTANSASTALVKDIITAIAATTRAVYSHTEAMTVTYDSEDGLIGTFQPKDGFAIYYGNTRKEKIWELLDWTKCVGRFEDDGELHVLVPTISGSTWAGSSTYALRDHVQPTTPNNNFTYRCSSAGTAGSAEPTWPTVAGSTVADSSVQWIAVAHDYEYALSTGSHQFFSKGTRERLVIPNHITIESRDGDSPAYAGTAIDSASNALLDMRDRRRLRLASSAQATNIAKALISHLQMDAERGYGEVPINVVQEVYDYIKITDTRQGDTLIANVQSIKRVYRPGGFRMTMRLGKVTALPMAIITPAEAGVTIDYQSQINRNASNIEILHGNQLRMTELFLALVGGTMQGEIDMNSQKITGLAAATDAADAARYDQLLAVSDYPRKLQTATVRWVMPGWHIRFFTASSLPAGWIQYIPIFVSETTTYIRIGIEVTTAAGGSTAELRIYNWNGGVPGTLVLAPGSVDTSTTGLKEITISQQLTRGYYFLAVRPTALIAVNGADFNYALSPPVPGLAVDQQAPSGVVPAVSAAFADPAPAPTTTNGCAPACVMLREN